MTTYFQPIIMATLADEDNDPDVLQLRVATLEASEARLRRQLEDQGAKVQRLKRKLKKLQAVSVWFSHTRERSDWHNLPVPAHMLTQALLFGVTHRVVAEVEPPTAGVKWS